jgi:hypothetical protein
MAGRFRYIISHLYESPSIRLGLGLGLHASIHDIHET